MKPLVSTILCSYNQIEYLPDAVESVRAQTYPSVELVIVDNGSTDGSRDYLKTLEGQPGIQLLLSERNEEVTRRLNQGIQQSRGPYISLLYADDWYLPPKLEAQVERLERLPPEFGVVYSPGYRVDVLTGKRWLDPTLRRSGWILPHLLLRHHQGFINPISPLMRRECFERYPFDERLFIEGEGIFLRFAMRYQFAFMDEPLVVMRDHSGNVGKAIKGNMERLMVVLDRLVLHPDFPVEYRGAVRRFRSRILRDNGWQGIRVVGDVSWARSCFQRAVSTEWRQSFHPRTIAGYGLSFFPSSVRNRVNEVVNRARRYRGNVAFAERPDVESA